MTQARWAEIQELFYQALEQQPAEIDGFLREAAGGDATLYRQVKALLDSSSEGHTLQQLIQGVAEQIDEPALRAGDILGPWRILRQLGEGGMGTVYLAERADDQFRKQVAVKLLQGSYLQSTVVKRFRAERQILANLEHPNIARLLDAGVSAAGSPYLVMEYVDGLPLTEYAKGRPERERLEFFRKVCVAVHAAHQSLIVHRDLKPSNILVTADGSPKLLDFGIAKILEPDTVNVTAVVHTRAMERLMTPNYASPEQVMGLPVTTASDVYSLGALLYELLSGKPPFDFQTKTLGQIETIVTNQEPPPLPGELGLIAAKALNKDAKRRYASAMQLEEDIGRYFDGLPILAKPDSWSYRTGKFLRRNKARLAVAGLVFASLLAGLVLAIRGQQQANRRFDQVREMAGTFMFDFYDAIEGLQGSLPARKMVVERTRKYLDRLAAEAGGNRDLQIDLAVAYGRLGSVFYKGGAGHLGDPQGAQDSFAKAIALLEPLHRADPRDIEAARQLAFALKDAGDNYFELGDEAKAIEMLRRAVAIADAIGKAEATLSPINRARLAEVYRRYASVTSNSGNPKEARPVMEKSVAILEQLAALEPDNNKVRLALAHGYITLGDMTGGGASEFHLGDRHGAIRAYDKSLAQFRILLSRAPENRVYSRGQQILYSRISATYQEMARYPEALAALEKSAENSRASFTADPKNAEAGRDYGIALNNLGGLYGLMKEPDKAIESLEKAVAHRKRLMETFPNEMRHRADLASSYHTMGGVEVQRERHRDAIGYYLLSIDLRQRVLEKAANNASLLWRQAKSWDELAASYEKTARTRDAREAWQQAIDFYTRLQTVGKLSKEDQARLDELKKKSF